MSGTLTPRAFETSIPTRAIPGFRDGSARRRNSAITDRASIAQPYGRAAIGFAPMGAEHDGVRARLGRVGVWTFAFDALRAADVRASVAAIEGLGYPALWVP